MTSDEGDTVMYCQSGVIWIKSFYMAPVILYNNDTIIV